MARDKNVFAVKLSAKSVPRPLIEAARWVADRVLGFAEFNAIYAALPEGGPLDLSQTLLDALHVKVAISGTRPEAIPASGPLIVVANHSFGLIEGLALDALLLTRRPDVTFLAIYVLAAVPEFRERWIFVDPERSQRRRSLNPKGLSQACEWLARGGVLGVFPAGGIARFSWRRLRIAEQPWSWRVAAIARQTQTKVLPVYFHGHNNWLFQVVGMVHPRLQHLRFIRELTNKRGSTLRVTIGRLIEPAELARFASDKDAIEFLKYQTEQLAQPTGGSRHDAVAEMSPDFNKTR